MKYSVHTPSVVVGADMLAVLEQLRPRDFDLDQRRIDAVGYLSLKLCNAILLSLKLWIFFHCLN